MAFAENLRHLMELNNVSNYYLAKKLGASQSSVANWISGNNIPHKKTKTAIAEVFGISLEEIDGDEKPNAIIGKKENLTAKSDEVMDIRILLEKMSTSELADLMGKIAQIMKDR